MDNQRKGKRKDPPETDCEQVTWRKFRLLDRDEQNDVPGVCSWRMNVGTVYKFDGKWISFCHLTNDQWAAIGNNWHPNFWSIYGNWDDEVNRCVNFPHEEVQVVAIPPDDHDTKYIMSSAIILEDHYKNGRDPPEEEIGIGMYLERKAFELDSDGLSYEADDSSSDKSTDNLLQPLSHSAITELQGEAPVVCFDSDREGQEVHE